MIEVQDATKRYDDSVAVEDLTFTVRPGQVTGFLGPNGSGKSTTMRLILGLDRPTSGRATVNGRLYRELPAPLREVGALLDARDVHPARTARNHLLALARSNRIPDRRVDEVLGLVGLADAAGQRAGGFSLGMGQRLGIAGALLGDPPVLVLDEPVNGLDTEGIRWIRHLMKRLAAEGRTVFVSSHLMSEMELTADHVVVIGRGRLIADMGMADLIATHAPPTTFVRSPEGTGLRRLLDAAGAVTELDAAGGLVVTGPDAAAIGDLAAASGIVLHELRPTRSSLEDVYSELTAASAGYRSEGLR